MAKELKEMDERVIIQDAGKVLAAVLYSREHASIEMGLTGGLDVTFSQIFIWLRNNAVCYFALFIKAEPFFLGGGE